MSPGTASCGQSGRKSIGFESPGVPVKDIRRKDEVSSWT